MILYTGYQIIATINIQKLIPQITQLKLIKNIRGQRPIGSSVTANQRRVH